MGEFLDTKGLACPLPVLKARKRLAALGAGERLTMLATDPAAVIDVPHFCNEQGHRLVETREEAGHRVFVIEKG